MATAEQIKALLDSHVEGDDERFYAIALQMAAHAARQGHGRIAQELRDKVDEARARASKPLPEKGPTPVTQPRGDLAGLLSVAYPKTRLNDMVLEEPLRARLARVLREQRQQHKLHHHGLHPRNKLLLLGPPGSGKTMTASALAGEMSLPLFTILLDGVITKYMGETSAKLRLVFDAINRTRGVYLFDEFDALGGRRSSPNDVGEIRRVLNSFLQFLEQADSRSIIVAATNHPELLDPALIRRFDDVVEYALPTPVEVEAVCRNKLALFNTERVEWTRIVEAAKGLSHSEVTLACQDAAKESILHESDAMTTEALLRAFAERHASRR